MSEVKRYGIEDIKEVLKDWEIDNDDFHILYKNQLEGILSDYEAKEAECKNLINRNELLVEELGALGELNSEHLKEINKLTAINKTLLDACESIEEAENCPNCRDVGDYAVYDVYGECEPEQCEWCNTYPKSLYLAKIKLRSAIQKAKTGGLKCGN